MPNRLPRSRPHRFRSRHACPISTYERCLTTSPYSLSLVIAHGPYACLTSNLFGFPNRISSCARRRSCPPTPTARTSSEFAHWSTVRRHQYRGGRRPAVQCLGGRLATYLDSAISTKPRVVHLPPAQDEARPGACIRDRAQSANPVFRYNRHPPVGKSF